MIDLTVIILTRDEAHHLPRALRSLRGLARRVVVVDSGSTDGTQAIARRMGAELWDHPQRTAASQFNWALAALGPGQGWVMRLDAAEMLSEALVEELEARLPALPAEIKGVWLNQRQCFLRRPLRWGGVAPIPELRLFRQGSGRCKGLWGDDRIHVAAPCIRFNGELINDNLGDLSSWTARCNACASGWVVDLLNMKYRFIPFDGSPGPDVAVGAARRPSVARALAGFLYRYILRLGFLDGREGAAFHVLQGLWFPFLVAAKLQEVETRMRREGLTPQGAIGAVLGLDVSGPPPRATQGRAA